MPDPEEEALKRWWILETFEAAAPQMHMV